MKLFLKYWIVIAMSTMFLCAPALAGKTKSTTKTIAGISYKLTTANPLAMGSQKLILKLSRGSQLLKDAKLTAVASMSDGMKTPVKITYQPNGDLELKTNFSMSGEWNLKILQTKPTKTEISFLLIVS